MITLPDISALLSLPEDPSSYIHQMEKLVKRTGIDSQAQQSLLDINEKLYETIESDFGNYSVLASNISNEFYLLSVRLSFLGDNYKRKVLKKQP